MTNGAKRPCAATTRAGRPCKNQVDAAHVFCDAHKPRLIYDDVAAVLASVEALGVLKEGERPRLVHVNPCCERLRDRSLPCTCQRVVLQWPDYDQMRVKAGRP